MIRIGYIVFYRQSIECRVSLVTFFNTVCVSVRFERVLLSIPYEYRLVMSFLDYFGTII